MTGQHPALPLLVCALLIIAGGCTTVSVENSGYENGNLSVSISSSTDIPNAWLQVTIYETNDLHQQEVGFIQTPVSIRSGENTFLLPKALEPGSYKLHIYVMADGGRKTATIRDIRV
jgi:hypothetical protein